MQTDRSKPVIGRAVLIAFAGGLVVATGTVILADCTALTPVETNAASAVIQVADAAVPGVSTALAVGQLLCAGGGGLNAIVDAITGKPFLVTGKPATVVANVCSIIGGTPVAPPATPTTVKAVPVAIPASAAFLREPSYWVRHRFA